MTAPQLTPWRRRHAPRIAHLLLVGALLTRSARAEPESPATPAVLTSEVQECARSHEEAHSALLSERWEQAREALHGCLLENCPLSLRADCVEWQAELERSLATVYIALPAEETLRGATMSVNGVLRPLPSAPQPMRIEPGRHRFEFQRPNYLPDIHEVELKKGEARQLNVRWLRPPDESRGAEPRPIPSTTYWLSVGAITAFASTAVLGGLALSSLSNARQTCAPTCDPERRTTINGLALAADTSAVLGILLSAFAVATYLERPAVSRPVPHSGPPPGPSPGAQPAAQPRAVRAPAQVSWVPRLGLSKGSLSVSLGSEF